MADEPRKSTMQELSEEFGWWAERAKATEQDHAWFAACATMANAYATRMVAEQLTEMAPRDRSPRPPVSDREQHRVLVSATGRMQRLDCTCGWEKRCSVNNVGMYRSRHYREAREAGESVFTPPQPVYAP